VIRNLIWDVDGTLFDTYPAIAKAFVAALDDLGRSAPVDWVESLARRKLSYCASTLASEFEISPEEVMRGFGRHYKAIPPWEQIPFPGVIEVCGYVSSTGGMNVIVTHRGWESTAQLLDAHNMTHYFADFLTRDDGYPRKPDPAAFEAMIKRHSFKREETLAVGDRDADVLAGQATGIRTCLFGFERGEVAPDIAITDYAELREFIVSENRG
jgi:phosphoglycolate phosphatase-like HAD superfamily hydrolase